LASSSPIDGTVLGQLLGKQFSPFMEMVCYRLWKWLATSPSYPRQYATALGNRLWKWLASSSPIDGTVLGQLLGKQFSPFMEMVCYRLWKWLATSPSYPRQYATALGNRLWKWLASSSPIDGTVLGQLLGKQFSPFMEMVCYRLWKWLATSPSYPRQYATALGNRLWKWLASSSPIDGTVLGQLLGKQFSPFMEMVGKQFSH
jgi:hypothetical protein